MDNTTTTKTTPSAPSAEEIAYQNSQIALANKQLDLLNSQQDFQKSYQDSIKPLLDQQSQLMQSQLDQINNPDPTAKAINDKVQALQLQALQDQQDLEPQQKALIQAQLDQVKSGYAATPEQTKQIDAATGAALTSGKSDISEFENTSLQALRSNLAPALGLRPDDTPITDRGQLVAKEAVRQAGQLETSLEGAGAQAKLNYPLQAGAMQQAGTEFAANLAGARSQFASDLSNAAAANRLNLVGAGQSGINTAVNGGIGLAGSARSNPLTFARGSTTTESKPMDFGSILGGAGGLMSGLGAIGVMSDGRTKEDVQTDGYDAVGHRWVRFKYKADPSKTIYRGVIAQEAERISPEAVLTRGDGVKFVTYNRLRKAA